MRTELTNRGEYSTIDDMVGIWYNSDSYDTARSGVAWALSYHVRSIWYNSDSYDTARSEAEWHGLYHTMCGAYGMIEINLEE